MEYLSFSFYKQQVHKGSLLAVIVVFGMLSIVGSGGGGGGGGGDSAGTLMFSSAAYNATEGTDPSVTVTVTRTGGSKGAASVNYATADGTATQPSDYTQASGTLNWADGDAAAKTFTVTIVDDSAAESAETLTVSLSNAVTAALGTPNSATISIADDDNPGTLQLSGATYSATEGTNPTVTITVTRTGGSSGAVAVDYATADGTATQPSDYTQASGTLNWTDGDAAAKTFTVTIVDDSAAESAETLTVSLSNAVTAALGTPNSATVSIADDDNPGTLQFSSATYSGTEGVPTVTISVTRTGGSSGAVSVDYATSDNTAMQPSDYTLATGTLSWTDGDSANKTFNVTIADDATVELVESFDVTLSNAVGASIGATSSASVSITDNDSIQVIGTVFAPSGALAFKEPSFLQRMFAALFGDSVNAAISDLVSPVASVTVAVYEVNAAGNLVSGTPISSTTTDSFGEFALTAPTDAPHVKYIVRASGSTETMDSRITSTSINVDPSTDATSRMVVAVASNLADITVQEVIEMQEDIAEFVTDIDTLGADASTLSTRLYDKALAQVGELNILKSKVSTGQICGHVQSASAADLEGILITVRDYNDRLQRAQTYTDASGDYCLNVPVQGGTNPDGGTFSGEYIIGAINRLDATADPEHSASEWLGSGTTYTVHEASKISVPSTTPVTGVDFTLEAGVHISGSVRATGSMAAVEGVQIEVSDFATNRRLATTRTAADGSYHVNVIPGSYRVAARNLTAAAYASEYYDASSGTNNNNLSKPVTATAGAQVTLDFQLETGSELSGTVTDSGPVIAEAVRIDVAGDANSESIDTDRNGEYSIWLKPDSYDVLVHGQRSLALDLSTSQTADFSGTVSTITGQLQDSSNNPVADSTLRLYHLDDPTTTSQMDIASSDSAGNFTLYTDQTGDHIIEARIGNDSTVGSIVYQGHTRQLSGDVTTISSLGSSTDVGTVNMPDGGMLKGHVYADSFGSTSTPMANFRVQVRDDDDLSTAGTGNTAEDRFLQTRTLGDGSFSIALPAGIYDRVKMRDSTTINGGNCNGITITAGATTVLNYYDGDNSCH